jgi:hypothetical protein
LPSKPDPVVTGFSWSFLFLPCDHQDIHNFAAAGQQQQI